MMIQRLYKQSMVVFTSALVFANSVAATWERLEAEEAGLDKTMLITLNQDIRDGKYSNIHSLLVIRNGKLVSEAYFSGEDERRGTPIGKVDFNAETLHDMRSITKSVVSILFGIALAEGVITDIDQPVVDLFPEYRDASSPEKGNIRLRDLLSMTSGLKWDEDSYPYGDARNSETAMDAAEDAYRYVLEQPMADMPGYEFVYNGGTTMLLAAIIERATRKPLDKYAEEVLFAPLEIKEYEWLKYSDGKVIAASGLRLLPLDAAKIGVMYLDKGRWQGKQVVPANWVADSLFPHANLAPRPTGFQHYGYQWWLGAARVNGDIVKWSAAVGWGGQRILIVPSMDLVAVITTGMYNDPRQTDITFEILLDRVLPAVKQGQ